FGHRLGNHLRPQNQVPQRAELPPPSLPSGMTNNDPDFFELQLEMKEAKQKYYAAICLLFRPEDPEFYGLQDIEEWLAYHLGIAGFDHIYMYDNVPTPETQRLFEEYRSAGLLTYYNFTGMYQMQTKMLQHCLNYGKPKENYARWMAVIDAD